MEDRFSGSSISIFDAKLFDLQSRKLSVLDEIEAGYFGNVYKGALDGSIVAVKIIDIGCDEKESKLVAVLAELSLLKYITHENIVRYYGAVYLPQTNGNLKVSPKCCPCFFWISSYFRLFGYYLGYDGT